MANPMTATVTIVLQPTKSPPFLMKSSLLQGKDLSFTNNKFPGFTINFTLSDPENSGYLFPTNPNDAFAAKEIKVPSDSCPNMGESWSELVPQSVSSDQTTLTVRNFNNYPADFAFSLFVTKGNGRFLTLDPIGANHNGPRSAAINRFTAIAIGVAVVIVVLFALYEYGVFSS
jgi:hypothetical protein